MDTTTGRFISQDSYSGSISDPISLHRYLYANANPVMYTDPSGCMSVAGMAVVGAISGALSGIIVPNVSSMLKNLDVNGVCVSTLSPIDNIKNALLGMTLGALFGVLWAVGACCVLAGVALFNGALSAIAGYGEYSDGNYRTAIAYSILSVISFLSFFKFFSLGNNPVPPSNKNSTNNEAVYYEYKALREQGFTASEAYKLIIKFRQGINPDDRFVFHFTDLAGGKGITDSGYIKPSTSGVAGNGVYAGTTPTPSWLLKHIPFYGWGLGNTPVRIPILIDEYVYKIPIIPIATVVIEGIVSLLSELC